MNVLVSDTSVLLDLERGALLEASFRLPFRFTVPDLLYERELKDWRGAELIRLVWCLTNTVMKLRGHFGRRQGAMTCRGGFQTRPCGRYHARKSNAADGQKDPQIRKRICETPH